MYGSRALDKLFHECEFNTVLDIGCGAGEASLMFTKQGKDVTAIDLNMDIDDHYQDGKPVAREIISGFDFNGHDFGDRQFDLIWASHVLEHQPNPHDFLKKCVDLARLGGFIAVTVPPLKHDIVGGHVTLWNGGLLLYHLVLAGLDCSRACLLQYGYNISVIVRVARVPIPRLKSDCGDIATLRQWLPPMAFKQVPGDVSFDGDLRDVRWQQTL